MTDALAAPVLSSSDMMSQSVKLHDSGAAYAVQNVQLAPHILYPALNPVAFLTSCSVIEEIDGPISTPVGPNGAATLFPPPAISAMFALCESVAPSIAYATAAS